MRRNGFTLLEVLIVVIIIGILAAIAMPQYIKTIEKARAGEAMTNVGSIRVALDRYYYENNFDLTGATLPSSGASTLDIDNPNDIVNKLYEYTISGLSGAGAERAYTITATRTAGGDTYYVWWIQEDNRTGALYKSTNLGGTGSP